MYQIQVGIGGAGVYGLSLGNMRIIVRWYDSAFVYECYCQGMSSSVMGTEPVTITNDIAGKSERMLLDLQDYDVKVTIPTSFVGWNKKIDFTFEVFDNSGSEPIFKTSRRPLAHGCCVGGITVLTTPSLVMQGTWQAVEQKLREEAERKVNRMSQFPVVGYFL